LLVYYLVFSVVLFALNFSRGVRVDLVFFFLPAVILLDYYIVLGLPGSSFAGRVALFVQKADNLLNFRKTFEEETKGKLIDSENLKNLEQVVTSLESRLRKPTEIQRKLYLFSIYAAPLFPMAVMLSSILLQRGTELYAGLFSYGASFIIVILARRAFRTLENTIEKLNNEIRKAIEDISYN